MKYLAAALSLVSFASLAQVIAPTYVAYPKAAPFLSGSTLVSVWPFGSQDVDMLVLPRSAPVGVRRWLVINNLPKMNCGLNYLYPLIGLDTGRLGSERTVTLKSDPPGVGLPFGLCPILNNPLPMTALFSFNPTTSGSYVAQWAPAGASGTSYSASFEASPVVQALGQAPDINGMWFDPATNGSGISFHQGADRKSVFGTWFMFDSQGLSRWYSLQELRWDAAHSKLEGVVIEARGELCQTLPACPSSATGATPTLEFRLTLSGANQARAEIFNSTDATFISSDLKRLDQ